MLIRIILAVAIIAAVIDAGVFFGDYFNKSFAADALNSQIESENQNLMLLRSKTLELNSQISDNAATADKATSAIAEESSKIPRGEISSNEIIGALLQLGQENHVSLIPLTTQDWSSVTTKDYSLRMLKMSLDVRGPKEQVIQTIQKLPQLYSTLVIENISLNKIIAASGAETTPSPDLDQLNAKLALAFYTN